MRVVLVEDHRLEREALTSALTGAGIDVLAHADTAADALRLVDDVAPDVVVLDLKLSEAASAREDEGLQVAEQLRSRQPEVGILVLSAYSQPAYAERLLALPQERAGLGYLLKGGPGGIGDLVNAIERVAGGEVVLDPDLIQRLLSRARPAEDPLTTLSPQELRVLRLIAQGRSNLKIAQELSCQISTVEKHASTIFTKLGLSADTSPDRRGYNARVMAALTYLRHNRQEP